MATTADYAAWVVEQLRGAGALRSRRMFGEYMVYINDKPIFLLCDNQVYVKMLPQVAELLKDAPVGEPYTGARPHHILDIDDRDLALQVAAILEPITPLPRPKPKKAPKPPKFTDKGA